MAQNSTTELEAVNTLLHSIGEASVNSLTNLPIDGTQAKNILTEVSREVQLLVITLISFLILI